VSAGHEDLRVLLGAYVLGGLDGQDRTLFEAHLPECAVCRAELTGVAPLPGLLRRLPGGAKRVAPSPVEILPRLLEDVRAERRRQRRRARTRALFAAAAAAVVLVAGGVATTLLMRETPAPPGDVAAVRGPAAAGQAQLTPKRWGTEIHLELSGLPTDGPFTLWVIADDGSRQQAAAWGSTPVGKARLVGATSVPRQRLDVLEVKGADGALIATGRPS
jgi:Putative zinc-finger